MVRVVFSDNVFVWPFSAGHGYEACWSSPMQMAGQVSAIAQCLAFPCAPLRAGLSCYASSLAKKPACLDPSGFNP